MNATRRQAGVAALGRTIRAERAAAGLTLDALGSAVGVHRNTVHNWEKGAREIPFGALIEIAAALDMRAADLVLAAEARVR